ncbi:hypothetical protein LINPERPRIM_LOCUS11188 [Linum perenne]
MGKLVRANFFDG